MAAVADFWVLRLGLVFQVTVEGDQVDVLRMTTRPIPEVPELMVKPRVARTMVASRGMTSSEGKVTRASWAWPPAVLPTVRGDTPL